MVKTEVRLRKYVLDYPVDLCLLADALTVIENSWQNNMGLHVITLNAEMIMAAKQDTKLDNIIRQAGLIIPDGAGVVLALKLQGCNTRRLPGIELAYSALETAAKHNISVSLIGGSPEVLNYLKHSLPQQIPGLNLVYCQDGYFKADQSQTIIDNINAQHAQLVLVAMGVPKQEYFIEKAKLSTNHTVFIGVGGSFDVWAGKKLRAPKVWQDYQMEWLYRLISEPWRFERMATTLPIFACRVIFNQVKMWLTPEQK